MKKLLLLALLVSLGAGFSACTAAKNTGTAINEGAKEAAEETSETVTDASITAAVKMKMADDETVKASNIDVDTSNGIVTLTGTVATPAEAQKAADLARSVDGVKTVISKLTVSPSGS